MVLNSSFHNTVKRAIFDICTSLGYIVKEEYSRKGGRTDIYVEANNKKFAFEIQISPQSLKKTIERLNKLLKDDVFGCWLFQKEPAKQNEELKRLPVFKIINNNGIIL